MANEHERLRKVAVLIDAENISPRIVSKLFDEIAGIGEASVRRIYGDFSGTHLKGWSEVLTTYAIVPQQNFSTTTGKNASDIALVIDAMDLLHTGRFDAFCVVSSDGDFTRLAARIREQGTDVYGFGERKAPESVRKACKRFIVIEPGFHDPAQSAPAVLPSPSTPSPRIATAEIRKALIQIEPLDGWYSLGQIGLQLATQLPKLNPKQHGCSKLVTLVEKTEAFDIRRENLTVYIRPKFA